MENSYTFNLNKVVRKKTKKEEVKLNIGQKVKFGFFTNLTFEGINSDGDVVLKDSSGNEKKHPVWLFEKYVEIL